MRLVCRELSGFDIALLGVIQLYLAFPSSIAAAATCRALFGMVLVILR